MKFLILIILFIVALFVIVPSVIIGIIRFLLNMLGGTSSRGSYRQGGYSNGGYGSGTTSGNGSYTFEHTEESRTRTRKKKVFDENEGEYVSFEEIKSSDNDKK